MTTRDSQTTRLSEYIKELLPSAHGHQLKAITTFVSAIIDRQTGTQAALARRCGNQEAAVKRLSRLIHNPRLAPHALAAAVMEQALGQLPPRGKVRLAIDWTIEREQYLLVVSLVTGGRAVPLYWRAYDQRVLRGRMRRYEMAIIKRVLRSVQAKVGHRRLRVTADRGFADVALCDLLEEFGCRYIIRVKSSTKVCVACVAGGWRQLQSVPFVTNARARNLGQCRYCFSSPRRLWVGMSRVLNETGAWEVRYLVSNREHRGGQMGGEYARRFGCEQGFRDAKRRLGFAEARVQADTGLVTFLRTVCDSVAGAGNLRREVVIG